LRVGREEVLVEFVESGLFEGRRGFVGSEEGVDGFGGWRGSGWRGGRCRRRGSGSGFGRRGDLGRRRGRRDDGVVGEPVKKEET